MDNETIKQAETATASVFEVCDTTDDEMYFTLGVFSSRDEALSAIARCDAKKEKVSDRAEEHEEISVFERKLGWGELGLPIIAIERNEYYDAKDDEYYWRRA